MIGKIKDVDKLIVIAETYSRIKGPFTANQLYDFLLQNNFKFHSDFTPRRIGVVLSRSSKFDAKKIGRWTKYNII